MNRKNLAAALPVSGICAAGSLLAVVFALPLSGCGKHSASMAVAASAASATPGAADAKIALLHDISGVWNPSSDNGGLWTLNDAGNSFQIIMKDQFISATIGDIDTTNNTVNLKIQSSDGAEKIMTVQKGPGTDDDGDDGSHAAQAKPASNGQINYSLTVTDGSGHVTALSFVHRIGSDDLGRLAQLQAQARGSAPPAPTSTPAPANSDQTYATSFDCAKANSVPEYLVCHDSDLATADRDLSAIYQRARDAVDDKAALADLTRRQWNFREKNCRDKACLLAWYQAESDTLNAIAQTGDVNAQPDQEQ
jgi:uncharacterized protein YecT (DUF1311 family)